MRLFEAIIDANHRAIAGDQAAGLRPAEFQSELPVVALTCIDVRLNPLLPEVLGLPEEQFIWLRNAGNVITGPLSSTMRSLALACVVKGGKEIAIIGHTDCQVSKTTTMELLDRFRALGIERNLLPANVNEFFGMFASPRANVIKAADIVRQSPLIGPRIPVHGLLVDIETGKLEWLVNGYQSLDTMATRMNRALASAGQTVDALKALTDFEIGGIKFSETKIGDTVTKAEDWLSGKLRELEIQPPPVVPAAQPETPLLQASAKAWLREKEQQKAGVPPKISPPTPAKPRLRFQKKPR
ncbi:MAG TPA: carbonic anhydrase [Candidatus Paceibacterota bacterium]|nr:carbonic anhydrase [Verrucomicrobiota bacterium]HSA09887.1 carbonic anhydrase [Candidatus Paceibacterota bacterium]